jgi:RimJ/RimL family protein N-acetyltransferase
MNPKDILQTERLILRQWRDTDSEPFARINADPRAMEFFPATLSREQSDSLIKRIEAHFHQHGFGLYAAELQSGGTFAGFVGLNVPSFKARFTPCVEAGWRIAPELWGQGLATEGARAVIDHGFRVVGLKEIVSFTVPANLRSRRVMEKLGMKHNPADDFDHPQLPPGHALRRHMLYRLAAPGGD